MTEKKRTSHGLYWILILLIGGMLALSMLVNGAFIFGFIVSQFGGVELDQAVDEYPQFTEHWSYGDGDVKAVRIAVSGVITREAAGGFLSPDYDPVENVIRQIRAAGHDDGVKAIILEVDSPGGGITPSDEIYRALLDFKATDPERKIIVFMKDLAASGGYLVSMAGDWLIAEPTSMIGSIGVILQTLNWKTLSEKIGVTDVTFKSGETKDILNPFRDVTEDEKKMMQAVIDNLYLYFFDIVVTGRQMDPDVLKPLADGRIFTAAMALEHGLIDEVGYWDSVMIQTREITGCDQIKVVRYETAKDFFQLLAQAASPLNPVSWLQGQQPRMMYLWQP